MNVLLLLHSTTGNTRLVTTYARKYLSGLGHECHLHDITTDDSVPDTAGFDMIGVASPTLYFRGSFSMERVLSELPQCGAKRLPVFLLATCAGEPGAQFYTQAEILNAKGYVTMGAHYMVAPSNWPLQLAITEKLSFTSPLGRFLKARVRLSRLPLSFIWPELTTPDERDRDGLEHFLREMVITASHGEPRAVPLRRLHRGHFGSVASGRQMTLKKVGRASRVHVNHDVCIDCGVCVKLCPESVIQKAEPELKPVVGEGCTGCYTCYNRCPYGAIESFYAKGGAGKYRGPSLQFRRVFS